MQVRQQTELRAKWLSKIRNHSIMLTEPDSVLEGRAAGRYSITILFSEFFHFEHLLCPRRLLLVRDMKISHVCTTNLSDNLLSICKCHRKKTEELLQTHNFTCHLSIPYKPYKRSRSLTL